MNDPNTGDMQCIVNNITSWVLGLAGLVIVLMIVIAGVRYIVSAGNPNQTEGAKKTLVGAIIGLIIIILAKVLISIVVKLITG